MNESYPFPPGYHEEWFDSTHCLYRLHRLVRHQMRIAIPCKAVVLVEVQNKIRDPINAVVVTNRSRLAAALEATPKEEYYKYVDSVRISLIIGDGYYREARRMAVLSRVYARLLSGSIHCGIETEGIVLLGSRMGAWVVNELLRLNFKRLLDEIADSIIHCELSLVDEKFFDHALTVLRSCNED